MVNEDGAADPQHSIPTHPLLPEDVHGDPMQRRLALNPSVTVLPEDERESFVELHIGHVLDAGQCRGHDDLRSGKAKDDPHLGTPSRPDRQAAIGANLKCARI